MKPDPILATGTTENGGGKLIPGPFPIGYRIRAMVRNLKKKWVDGTGPGTIKPVWE